MIVHFVRLFDDNAQDVKDKTNQHFQPWEQNHLSARWCVLVHIKYMVCIIYVWESTWKHAACCSFDKSVTLSSFHLN